MIPCHKSRWCFNTFHSPKSIRRCQVRLSKMRKTNKHILRCRLLACQIVQMSSTKNNVWCLVSWLLAMHAVVRVWSNKYNGGNKRFCIFWPNGNIILTKNNNKQNGFFEIRGPSYVMSTLVCPQNSLRSSSFMLLVI